MAPSFATLFALAATVASPALAELKQLTLTVPIAIQTDYEVSVISTDSTSTAFAVKCATSQKCDLAPGATLKQGPSTVAMAFAQTSGSKTTLIGTVKCAGTSCTMTSITSGTATASTAITNLSVMPEWVQVVLVTGAEKLAQQTGTGAGEPAKTLIPPTTRGSDAALQTPFPTPANGTAVPPASTSEPPKTGAAWRLNGGAVAAGVVAVVGGAMVA